jgi:NAD(P)-dependent dehydrogenase (short-subunit alcohol dehydrogenase family)
LVQVTLTVVHLLGGILPPTACLIAGGADPLSPDKVARRSAELTRADRNGVEFGYKRLSDTPDRQHALGRNRHVDELAALVAFVAGQEASYITVANLTVDGVTNAWGSSVR